MRRWLFVVSRLLAFAGGVGLLLWLLPARETRLVQPVAAQMSCDDSSATTTSAGLDTFLDGITTGGTAGDPRVVCLTASAISLTSAVTWTAPANTVLLGAGSLTTMGGGDATVLSDNYNVNASVFTIHIASTGVFRLAGLTFQTGTATTAKDSGAFTITGPGTVRLDHIHLIATSFAEYKVLVLYVGVFGVIDHSIIDLSGNFAVFLYNSRSGTGDTPHHMGNYEWSLPTGFGTADFFFFEDNQINGNLSDIPSRMSDSFTAGRVVSRFNTLKYTSGPEMHATGHSGEDRGGRATEVYGNYYGKLPGQGTTAFDLMDAQSGPSLTWNNTVESGALNHFILFNVVRNQGDAGCGGTGTYCQGSTPNDHGYCGTEFSGTGSAYDGNTNTTTGYPCMDQPGRGQGDVMTGAFPNHVNSTTGKISWPNQALEPIYVWNIVGTPGGLFYRNASNGRVVADRDYYAQASGIQVSNSSPFNGTTGTGWGTIANRPPTCTAGVGYFATDQGSWNTSISNPEGVQQNGADGVLYKCVATDTWSSYYTPYTYPHPLQEFDAPEEGGSVIRFRFRVWLETLAGVAALAFVVGHRRRSRGETV